MRVNCQRKQLLEAYLCCNCWHFPQKFAVVLGNEGKVKVCLGLAKNFCADASKLAAAEKQIRGIEANAVIVTVQGNPFR